MKRYIVKLSIIAVVATIGGIAIAQAESQSEEPVVLPPPPTSRAVDNSGTQPAVDAQQNPLRGGYAASEPASPSGPLRNDTAVLPQSPFNSPAASDPFMGNSASAPGPIRMAAYNAPAETPNGPTLAPARASMEGLDQDQNQNQNPNQNIPPAGNEIPPAPSHEYQVPAMTPPQPSYVGELGTEPNSVGKDYGYPPSEQLSRAPADLNQRPQDLAPAGPQEPYDTSRNYPSPMSSDTAAPSSEYQSPNPIRREAYDPPSSAAEPAPLSAPQDGQRPTPMEPYRSSNNYGDTDRGSTSTGSGYGTPSQNYTAPSSSTYQDQNQNAYPNQNLPSYASNQKSPNELPSGGNYSAMQPMNPSPTEPSGPTGTGRPAQDESWNGMQTPHLQVVKLAPKEIQVGKPATFRVEIKNVGRVTAHGVEVRDQIPQSTRLIDTTPASVADSHGGLVWQLGKIKPGETTSVEMKLMPTDEGDEIGSVAMVRFGTPASVRTVATKPILEVEVVAEDKVMVESEMTLTIRISNPGSGAATGVVLEERIPQGLQHPAGAELEYEVGNLPPKASKTIQLKLSAIRPGMTKNVLIARAEGLQDVTRESNIEVVAPELKVAMRGPSSRYLNRKASYEVSISNPGSAAARDVRLTATLPPGLKFVEANNNGHYDASSRTVQWALAELPVNETGTVQLTALPVEMGDHAVKIQGTADRAVAVKQERKIAVDGIAALRFEVVDVKDPIEVGSETAYEIRVLNQGTKDASNVVVQATLPPGLELVAAEGPGSLRHSMQNGRLVFEPIRRLAPKVDTSFRIRVRGRQAGDQRLRVDLNSDDLQTPVTKEESTRVFGDQ